MAGRLGYTLSCTFIFYQNKKLSKVSLSLQLVILGYKALMYVHLYVHTYMCVTASSLSFEGGV